MTSTTQPQGSPRREGEGRFILLVDDDADAREATAKLLEEHGYLVASADNGAEAFAALVRWERLPDIVLLDLMMPVMNGWEALDVFKEDARLAQIPVVVLSAHPSAKVPLADAFLAKPFGGEELLAVLREQIA